MKEIVVCPVVMMSLEAVEQNKRINNNAFSPHSAQWSSKRVKLIIGDNYQIINYLELLDSHIPWVISEY